MTMLKQLLKKFFLICILCILASRSFSQTPIPIPFTKVGVFYDQDYTLEWLGLGQLNEDRNYTMGFGAYCSSDGMSKWIIYQPNKWLFKKLNPRRADKSHGYFSLMFANGTFTPDSLPATYPITNDRPYASLTYLQANANFVDNERPRVYSYSISVGMIGLNISREVQTFIHTHMNDNDTKPPRTPRGWQYQISEGGSPTILLSYQQDYLLTTEALQKRISGEAESTRRIGGEWKAAWKASIGWYNMVAGELSYRFGWIDPKGWAYMNNPLGSSNMVANPGTGPVANATTPRSDQDRQRAEVYLFATARPNFIAYNVLLSGQGGDDPVTIPNFWARHGVLDGAIGICISPVIAKRINPDLKVKVNFRSPEFQAPDRQPRWHFWGGIDLVVTVLHKS